MDPCVPLPLAQDKLEDLVDKAKDYCLMHGNVSKISDMMYSISTINWILCPLQASA